MTLKDIRPALRAALLADSAVSTAVGGARIYPQKLPQGQRSPSVVYNRVAGGDGVYTYQGPCALLSVLMQVDCWAQDPDAATELALKVRERLEGFAGIVSYGLGSPQDEIEIQGVFVERNHEDYDANATLYRDSTDYRVHYKIANG